MSNVYPIPSSHEIVLRDHPWSVPKKVLTCKELKIGGDIGICNSAALGAKCVRAAAARERERKMKAWNALKALIVVIDPLSLPQEKKSDTSEQ